MLIKDIRYPKLKALAKKYAILNNIDDTDRNISNLILNDESTFRWGDSSEGADFWNLVNNKNYKEAREIFDWDKQDDKDIEVKEILKEDEESQKIFKDLEDYRKNPRQFDINPILEHSSATSSLLNKIDDSDYDFSELVDALNNKVFNPQPHYDNSKPGGSLYKVATERGWNAYLFDVVKRIERGGKKENNPLRQEIEKSIDVFKIWLNEL